MRSIRDELTLLCPLLIAVGVCYGFHTRPPTAEFAKRMREARAAIAKRDFSMAVWYLNDAINLGEAGEATGNDLDEARRLLDVALIGH